MSDRPREPDPALGGSAVDQAARQQTIIVETDPVVPDEEDVVETLKRQLEQLEGSNAEDKKGRETAERARQDAERRASDAEARARQADQHARQASQDSQRSTAEAQLDSVKNALAAHESKMTALEGDYAAASAEGDFAKSAKVQREMAVLGGRIAQLESGRDALEIRIKEPPADTARQADQQPSDQDRKESFIRGQPPRVQDWLRSDKGARYFSDNEFQRKVAAAASFAQSVKGISIDTQDYIDYIEEQVGLRQAAPPAQQQQPPAGRNAEDRRMTTAPAGGSTGGAVRSNADGSTTIYLTPDEKATARREGMTDVEYARHKRDLINEGLIGPGARNR